MTILVTGGAGFIGSTLVPMLLAGGHRVHVLDSLLHGGQSLLGVWNHPGFEFIKGDIRDADLVRSCLQGVDAVVHLAAIVGDPACARQPELARAVNLEASIALIDESEKAGVGRFVFASTCSNYGKMPDSSVLADEDSELRPVSLYAETKVAVERALLDQQRRNMCCTPLRFATIFGVSPRMRFDLTVNEFTVELLTKKHLVVFGEQFWRPYVHVQDAARAIMTVLESQTGAVKGQVFNVGSTELNYQKQQIVDLILPHAEGSTVEYVHKDEDPRDYRVSFTKIKETLQFQVTRSVEDGIREVALLVKGRVLGNFFDPVFRN